MSEQDNDNAENSSQLGDLNQDYNEASYTKALEYLKLAKAYIEIRIEESRFQLRDEPIIIAPAPIEGDESYLEFVYPIHDYGDRLIACKQSDHEFSHQTMSKMYYTIEKMIFIWYEKVKALGGGDDQETLVYLDGHKYCMRKAFETIINIPDNWIVMNFDPEAWGHQYLETLNRLRKKNFDFPSSAPREDYKHLHGARLPKQSIKK